MKRVFIRRAPNHTGLPNEYKDAGKNKIGGCAYGESPLTGLTEEEIESVMPRVLGVNPKALDFREKVNRYFEDIDFNVPAGTGLELNIEVKDEVPANPRDFVRYKYALAYPGCAKSEEAVLGGGYDFFIFDEGVKLDKDYALLKARKEATRLYLEVSNDIDTVDMILTMLGDNPKDMQEGAKMIALETASTANPERFVKIASDKNLALKAKVQVMVSKEIIHRAGNTYVFGNEKIGNHVDSDPYKEIVIYMKDPVNSENYIRMFSKLGEEPLDLKSVAPKKSANE